MVRRTIAVAALTFAVAIARGGHLQAQSGRLQRIAATAKLQGKTSATILSFCECLIEPDPLPFYSVYLVTALRSPAGVFASDFGDIVDISTWHTFKLNQTLSLRATPEDPNGRWACAPALPGLTLAADELAIATGGGTLAVDGVAITEKTGMEDFAFKPNSRYVLLGFRCPSGEVHHFDTLRDVIEVTADGRLLPFPSVPLENHAILGPGGISTLQDLIDRLAH